MFTVTFLSVQLCNSDSDLFSNLTGNSALYFGGRLYLFGGSFLYKDAEPMKGAIPLLG